MAVPLSWPHASPVPRSAWARRLLLASGLIAALCITILVVDHGVARLRASGDAARVAELTARTGTDAGAAPLLEDERKRQTDASLARRRRSRSLAWTLLVAGSVFVLCGRWVRAEIPAPAPPLDVLKTIRFGAPPPAIAPVEKSPAPPVRTVADAAAGSAPPTAAVDVDLGFIDDLVARLGGDGEAIIPILQAIQEHYRYLPDLALARVCATTAITPAQIAGTSTFYSRFRVTPVGRKLVRVCHGTACHVAGAGPITDELRRHLGIAPDEDTDPARRFTVESVACVGCCSLAPVLMIEDRTVGHLTPATARQVLDAEESAAPPGAGGDSADGATREDVA